ncbi:potassium-transporting ATPase subunit KdpC [Fictibacillus sp. Mic-4]|uniref:potassium-transporting ATPase subunit KdpC n=1 Tax=Fictibacillus TaxID=1329200 RepID=UPI00040124E5|nr:potassium-transporting ATPase subunit KdpC [Fictibacillus gelatini]
MFKIIRLALLMIVVCGIAYPLAMTGLAQMIFHDQANGSLIKEKDGKVVGSELIGQNFKSPQYFHGRVSSIHYDAAASGSNNYGPTNKEMLKRTNESINLLKKENPGVDTKDIPVDLITNSGSGLDPDISVKAAKFQVDRVSKATGVSRAQLNSLIDDTTKGRSLGLFGEPRVNVLELNIKLQKLLKS